jgi:hypothetical protein
VAASSSDELSDDPSADDASTTEAFSLDLTGETVAAFAASVDDANIATVTEFIEVIGAKETGDCMRAAFEAEMALEPDDSEVPVEFEISVTNEGDLGIGDRSAALGYELTAVFIMPIEIELDVVFSQVGSDVVGLVHTVSGEPTSGFDPVVELQAIVDSLAG